jgi:AraC-like DNA-binding protein
MIRSSLKAKGERQMTHSLVATVEALIAAQGGGQGVFVLPLPGVHIMRTFQQMVPVKHIYRPSLCVVLGGANVLLMGSEVFHYGPMECLVVSVEMPAVGRIKEGSQQRPYLGLTVELDVTDLREILAQLPPTVVPWPDDGSCAFVGQVDGRLADCLERLVGLTNTPDAISVLYPLLMREIYYWLLSGPNGHALAHLALPGSHISRVSRAIQTMHMDLAKAYRVEELAKLAGMSVASFHRNFKQVTALSPLQFQKQLRLMEARRIMVAEAKSVAEAAYAVGYESVSQFSREYARAFGDAPRRDVAEQLRLMAFAARTGTAQVA